MKNKIQKMLERLCNVSGNEFWNILFFSDGTGFIYDTATSSPTALFSDEGELIQALKDLINESY